VRYPAGRIALWQAAAGLLVAVPSGWIAGWQGFVSALLGGFVNVSAGIVFAMLANLGRPTSAGATVHTMLRAEVAKVTVIVLQMWLVLSGYRDVVPGAFLAAFAVTLLMAQAAILIRD
jgi:F0F1-type ATP synthase assembly protein I